MAPSNDLPGNLRESVARGGVPVFWSGAGSMTLRVGGHQMTLRVDGLQLSIKNLILVNLNFCSPSPVISQSSCSAAAAVEVKANIHRSCLKIYWPKLLLSTAIVSLLQSAINREKLQSKCRSRKVIVLTYQCYYIVILSSNVVDIWQ